MQIRLYEMRDLPAVVRLSLRAWAPVFESIEKALDAELYREFYPDWRASQQHAVEAVCADPQIKVWVAVDRETVIGFVAIHRYSDQIGEIQMLAVDPDSQRQGAGKALTEHALVELRSMGFPVAMVETGADPGHAPARRTYEQCGFHLLPAARYFKKL